MVSRAARARRGSGVYFFGPGKFGTSTGVLQESLGGREK